MQTHDLILLLVGYIAGILVCLCAPFFRRRKISIPTPSDEPFEN